MFDIASVPVLHIAASDVDESVLLIRAAIRDRLAEREMSNDLRVAITLEGLSQFEVNLVRSNSHFVSFWLAKAETT